MQVEVSQKLPHLNSCQKSEFFSEGFLYVGTRLAYRCMYQAETCIFQKLCRRAIVNISCI